MPLIKLIRRLVSPGPVLLSLSGRRAVLRNVATGARLDWPTAVAVNHERTMCLGFGSDALSAGGVLEWPFDHPRTLLKDFQLAEKFLQNALRVSSDNKIIRPSPVLVIHCVEEWEGGLTQIEVRALRELGYGAGAREVYLWQGSSPTDLALQSGEFKRSSQVIKT